MTVRTALLQGAKLLEEGAIAAPRLTAEVLLGHALSQDRAWLFGHPEYELREVEWLHFGRYLSERLDGKPTQYITHRQEFFGRDFLVTPAVLIPRPETELLVETARDLRPSRVLDVGCGSGAIAITLRLETGALTCATDISGDALGVARSNCARLGAEVWLLRCDLASPLADRSFDMVVSNPPYVPRAEVVGLQREVRDWEPLVALEGGETGIEITGRLIGEGERVLRPGGHLLIELGFSSAGRVKELLSARWSDIRFADDLSGIPRLLYARLT